MTGGTIQQLAGPSRAVDIGPNPAREGELVTLSFRATGGDLAVLAFSPEPAFSGVSGLDGLRLVGDPLRLITIGAVPPGGSIDAAFFAPTLAPGFEALAMHCQLLTANVNGESVLGESDLVFFLDAGL